MAVAKRAVQQVISKNIETKQSVNKVDTKNILHNRINIIDSNMFNTTPGTADPMTSDVLNRIGDEVNLRGISLKFLVEQQVYLADVTYRFMIIKSAKGDTPTDNTLFSGLSGAKIIDQINIERYTVVFSKTFSLHSRPMVTGNSISGTGLMLQGSSGPTTGTQLVGGTVATELFNAGSRPTRVVKIWIPGKKLFRNGVIKYESNSAQTKFFDYHFLCFAYINSEADSSNSGTVIGGLVKHYYRQMYYKDA